MNKTLDAAGTKTTRGAANKLVNIFDGEDSRVVKGQALQAIGHDERALVSAESSQHSDISKSAYSSRQSFYGHGKRNTIEYLNKSSHTGGGETVRDFVVNSRKILMAQIQINQKTEETELLREYIVMEKDKLDEGRKTFQEDKEKYEKFKMDLQSKSH